MKGSLSGDAMELVAAHAVVDLCLEIVHLQLDESACLQ